MKERKRKRVLQSARADGDGMRRPPGHLITGAGREEEGEEEEVVFTRENPGGSAQHATREEVSLWRDLMVLRAR